MSKDFDPRTKAIASQLKVEIGRSKFGSVAGLHRHLTGEGYVVDYANLTQRVKGVAPLPMDALFLYLDALGVEVEPFFDEAFRYYRREAG